MDSQKNHPQRDIRLDFFRGLALMVIFINHMPFNEWFLYTPSRFGFSDAAEAFVFISGFASARAYGNCFASAGLGLGTVRVLHRCWQIYASHLGSFFLLAAICVFGNQWADGPDYIERLGIRYFFDQTPAAVAGLFTLGYVPHSFDILPMYLVMMLWIPPVWLLSRLHTALGLAFPAMVYWGAWRFGWELEADPATGRPWFFNPFAWQLMFFTGFALGAGWLPAPKPDKWLDGLCLLAVAAAAPLGHEPTYAQIAFFGELRQYLEPWLDKTHLGILRWVHFLALAHLMSRLCQWKPHWLRMPLPSQIAQMGQQALPAFLLCMGLSYLGGMALDRLGREAASVALVNLTGLGLMLAGTHIMAWLDSKPWRAAVDGRFSTAPRIAKAAPQGAFVLLLLFSPWLLLRHGSQAEPNAIAQAERPAEAEGGEEEPSPLQHYMFGRQPPYWEGEGAVRRVDTIGEACDWPGKTAPSMPQESNLETF